MVDFILLAFVLMVFAAGFWCGQKYRTLDALKTAFKNLFK